MLASADGTEAEADSENVQRAYARRTEGDLPTGIDALTALNAVMRLPSTVRHTAQRTVIPGLGTISRTTHPDAARILLRESAPDYRRDYSWQSGRGRSVFIAAAKPGLRCRGEPRPQPPVTTEEGARHHNFRGDNDDQQTDGGTDVRFTTSNGDILAIPATAADARDRRNQLRARSFEEGAVGMDK